MPRPLPVPPPLPSVPPPSSNPTSSELSGVRIVRPGFRVGSRVGDYVLERRIGRGGMAEVWRATPLDGADPVAIKRMLPTLNQSAFCLDLFLREARLGLCIHHPNLVRCRALEYWMGEPYLVSELVDGPSAADLLRSLASRGERMPLPAALYIAHRLLEGLAHLHALVDESGRPLGVVHRDVSPANVFLAAGGVVKLGDFGIAQLGETRRPTPGVLQGKRGYMAPEQIAGEALDARSDVFAAAIVILELCTGETPHNGDSELASLLHNYERVPAALARVPEAVRAVLARALSAPSAERHGAARAMQRELERAAARENIAIGPETLNSLLARLSNLPRRCASGLVRRCGSGSQASDASSDERAPTPSAARACWTSALASRIAERALAIATGSEGTKGARDEERVLLHRLDERSQRLFGPVHSPAMSQPITPSTLPAILFELASARANGLLIVWRPGVEKRVQLAHGLPVFIASSNADELLGARLVSAGVVTAAQVEQALELALRNSCRLGEALIDIGATKPVIVVRALIEQMRDRYAELGSWRSGVLSFAPDAEPVDHVVRIHDTPESLVVRAVRSGYAYDELASLCRPLDHLALELTVRPRALERLGFTNAELRGLLGGNLSQRLRVALSGEGSESSSSTDFLRALYIGAVAGLVRARLAEAG